MKRNPGIPKTSPKPPGNSGDLPRTHRNPPGPTIDNDNEHISTNLQRQKLSIAESESSLQRIIPTPLECFVMYTTRTGAPFGSPNSPMEWRINCASAPDLNAHICTCTYIFLICLHMRGSGLLSKGGGGAGPKLLPLGPSWAFPPGPTRALPMGPCWAIPCRAKRGMLGAKR